MVRGAALRVTALDTAGRPSNPIRGIASRSVVSIEVNEVSDESADETLRDDHDQPRIRIESVADTLGYTVDVKFAFTNIELLQMMTGQPLVFDPFGELIGFDGATKIPATAFALEVWSRLVDRDDQWGYTLFPFLKGGRLGGFTFDSGRVAFELTGARTMRMPQWAVGPYDFTGRFERLLTPVSGNSSWRNMLTSVPPPDPNEQVVEFDDLVSNGSPENPHPIAAGTLSGGTPGTAGPWIVYGGAP